MKSNLSGSNLVKTYADGETQHRVLDELSLDCESGEIVAVTGDSGSGKTTLVNVLSGIETPESGEVTLGTTRIDTLSERERTLLRRERIGMIFQFFNLIPTLTVRENIEFPLTLVNRSNPEAVDHYLENLSIAEQADQFPSTLSGGERQRVAIARSLVHEPEVVFADEPTGNLDEGNSRTVLNTFRDLCRDRDVTVLLSTHSKKCAQVADRRLELQDGVLRYP
jgi:putative ABC transport system ATP-binding protein